MSNDASFSAAKAARGVPRGFATLSELTAAWPNAAKGALAMVGDVLYESNGSTWAEYQSPSLAARVAALETKKHFGLYRTSTTGLSIPNATFTDVSGWSLEFGNSSDFLYSVGSITIPETGEYRFDIGLFFRPADTGQRTIILGDATSDTGNRLAISLQQVGQGTLGNLVELHKTLNLTAGAKVYLYAYQSSGAALSVFASDAAGYRDYWQVRKVS
jgi:hypothetical protein